eukprot:scaffold1246_cov134-Cylindrotheca_fusiformis.AAC.9
MRFASTYQGPTQTSASQYIFYRHFTQFLWNTFSNWDLFGREACQHFIKTGSVCHQPQQEYLYRRSIMKLSAVALLCAIQATSGFVLPSQNNKVTTTSLNGYLDDLTQELQSPDEEPERDDSYEGTRMKEEDKDRYGVGKWDNYVEFEEFDGGDGQMGVAGDGNKKLQSFDMSSMAKSKMMSAKNAWGTSTGYADTLVEKGIDSARAQQLENWHNQQEVIKSKKDYRMSVSQYDTPVTAAGADEDWRNLSSFGVERNQEFDLDSEFGPVVPGDVEGTIEVKGRIGGAPGVHEFGLKVCKRSIGQESVNDKK